MLGVSIGVLMLGAAIGRAEIVPLISTDLDVTAYINRTVNWSGSGYDQLDVMISSLNGPASGYGINIVEGTWAITGGNGAFNLVSDAAVAGWNSENGSPASTWGDFSTSTLAAGGYPQSAIGYGQSAAPLSYVNLGSDVANYSGWGRTGSGQAFTSFDGSWYTTNASNNISDGVATTVTTMATLYVPTGSTPDLSYTGALSFDYGGGTVLRGSLQVLPGDANGDGKVDVNDLTVALAHYNQTGMSWSQGEFTGSGKVDVNDLTIILSHYNASIGATDIQAVPEPSALVLIAVGILGLLGLTGRSPVFGNGGLVGDAGYQRTSARVMTPSKTRAVWATWLAER